MLKHNDIITESITDDLKSQLGKVGSAFLTYREVSIQAVVCRIVSLPMNKLSRSVVSINTNPKNERTALLKNHISLSQLNDDDTNVFQKTLIGRCQHRPQEFKCICLASLMFHMSS